jgi:hypothetical protein
MRYETLVAHVVKALEECAPNIRRAGAGRYRLGFGTGRGPVIGASITNRWLHFEMPLRIPISNGRFAATLWRCLCASASIPGGKITLEADGGSVRLREDVPLDADADITQYSRDAVRSLVTGRRRIMQRLAAPAATEIGDTAGAGDTRSRCDDAPSELIERLVECGWPVNERGGGKLAITLDVPDSFHQALCEPDGATRYRVSVPLTRYESLPGCSRDAAALFLATMNGVVRFARTAVEEENGGARIFSEVRFTRRSPSRIVHEAIAALSVACRFSHRELRAFRDERVAFTYASVRGRRPRSNAPHSHESSRRRETETCLERR